MFFHDCPYHGINQRCTCTGPRTREQERELEAMMSKPSEKAMRLAETLSKRVSPVYNEFYSGWRFDKENAAHNIDAHTAEALSEQATFYQKQLDTLTETVKEHKRVLELAWHALNHSLQCDMETKAERQPALDAMAAIAELKTNEKP